MAQASVTAHGAESARHVGHDGLVALVVGSVGVVYGDIGTSPLYAIKEAITHANEKNIGGADTILGVLSIMVWTIVLVVTLKYVLVLLRADNNGEGGTFALMALGQSVANRSGPVLLVLGVLGASFFYGDAIITPAISVISAVEGLKVLSPTLDYAVLPLTLVIIVGLFAMQSRGTGRVAQFFGPIMLVWFLVLAVGGLANIFADLRVFHALNPYYAGKFLVSNGLIGLSIMGLVFLCATGAEALYADLGHFGRKPIQIAWFSIVLPCLLINYFGQCALLLGDPAAIKNPFYLLYPEWSRPFIIVLATMATIIASQAVITGAFSITRQAIQLGLLPRQLIKHTSESVAGQIFLPRINWLLCVGVVMVTIMFQSSSKLAAAYGVSVTAAMVIDSLMAFFVIWRYWKWSVFKTAALIVPLVLIEQVFFAANAMKIPDGGWFPLVIALGLAIVMQTWVAGSKVLGKASRKNEAELGWLVRKLEQKPPHRVPGTAVFLTGDPDSAPSSLMHNLKHNRVLHERNIILTIKTEDVPRVVRHERIHVDKVSDTFIRVVARYGFMETPSVPKILEQCRRKDLNIEVSQTSFFLSRRKLRTTKRSELPAWQERLFIGLAGTAEDATAYFQIPTDRVVEVGTQVVV
jgi:KUP system potassium uptake protein